MVSALYVESGRAEQYLRSVVERELPRVRPVPIEPKPEVIREQVQRLFEAARNYYTTLDSYIVADRTRGGELTPAQRDFKKLRAAYRFAAVGREVGEDLADIDYDFFTQEIKPRKSEEVALSHVQQMLRGSREVYAELMGE